MWARTFKRSCPALNSGTSPTSARLRRIVASVSAIRWKSVPAKMVSTRAKRSDSSVASCSTERLLARLQHTHIRGGSTRVPFPVLYWSVNPWYYVRIEVVLSIYRYSLSCYVASPVSSADKDAIVYDEGDGMVVLIATTIHAHHRYTALE
jgi:hypothetical protein